MTHSSRVPDERACSAPRSGTQGVTAGRADAAFHDSALGPGLVPLRYTRPGHENPLRPRVSRTSARTDLGFTRDRHLKMRKSGEPDLRARAKIRDPGATRHTAHGRCNARASFKRVCCIDLALRGVLRWVPGLVPLGCASLHSPGTQDPLRPLVSRTSAARPISGLPENRHLEMRKSGRTRLCVAATPKIR